MSPTEKFILITLIIFGLILPIQTPLEFPILRSLIVFIVNLIVLTLILYVAGLAVVGGERAKLSNAFAIAFLGTLINFVLALFFNLLALPIVLSLEYMLIFRLLLSFIVWLSLIKNFYKTGWLGALAVAILTGIIMIVLELLLTSFLLALQIFV